MNTEVLDRSAILAGTVRKSLGLAYQAMSENYTKETAENYYYEYCTLPLSLILEHSRKIFSDFYYGYDFYSKLVDMDLIPPTCYDSEIEKVDDLLATLEKSYYKGSEMYEKTAALASALEALREKRMHLIDVLRRADSFQNDPGENFSTLFFNQLYELSQEPDDYADLLNNLISAVYDIKQPILTTVFGFILAMHEESAVPYLFEYSRIPLNYRNSPKTDENLTLTESWIYKSRLIELTIGELMKDVDTLSELKEMDAPPEMIQLWEEIGKKNLSGQGLFTESAIADSFQRIRGKIVNSLIGNHSFDSPMTMASFFEDEDTNMRLQLVRYDNTCNSMAFVEAAMDFLKSSPNFESVSEAYETHDDIWCGLWANKQAFMEWEDDGRPNAVFRSRIKTHVELKKKKEEEEKDKTSMKKELDKEIDEKQDAIGRKRDLIERIEKEIEKVDSETVGSSGVYTDKVIRDAGKAAKKFREELRDIKDGRDEILDKIRELEDSIETASTSGAKSESAEDGEFEPLDFLRKDTFDMYMEDFREDVKKPINAIKDRFKKKEDKKDEEGKEDSGEKETEDSKEKEDDKKDENTEETNPVEKPKEDLPTKIQNKALDHAAKTKEKDAERMEKKQKIKNAANAVSEKPKEKLDDVKRFGRKWEKWDDNARKEFMLKPGNRHKIMRKFRTALLYGATAHIKLSYLPVIMLLRHYSKSKDRRIRNELSMELDSEIKICEEKIRDADMKEDREKKYELMRIRDKLNAERTRVRVNAKYL